MKVALVTRSTLFTAPGGDTIQVEQTARYLEEFEVQADIKLSDQVIDYSQYDILHFFNLIRPADILKHLQLAKGLTVLSPIMVDYSEYDRKQRTGLSGSLFKLFSGHGIEYLKTAGRWLKGTDKLVSKSYLWKGHRKSMQEVLQKVDFILPAADKEWELLNNHFRVNKPYLKISNGVDTSLFKPVTSCTRDPQLILCVARIEGLKNQLNLIKALSGTKYKLLLVGSAAPNQKSYLNKCKSLAASNVTFIEHMPQKELLKYYSLAKVHVLPSWFEVCGLSSLEAAAMGCQVVISDKGYTREYFGGHAFYCDPDSPDSILAAIDKAANTGSSTCLQENIKLEGTWRHAASKTASVYKRLMAEK